MKTLKIFLYILLINSFTLYSHQALSACLSGLTTSAVIKSKIRGFYINANKSSDEKLQVHYVILDKTTCTASKAGDVTLGDTTVSHYYLQFYSKDKTLYSSLLAAQAQDITVEFRMTPTTNPERVNKIAYIITPAGARSQ